LTLTPGEDSPAARISAGRVGRPHGLDGSFYVTQPRGRLLRVGLLVEVAGRGTRIVRFAGTEQRPIVRLDGVDGREAAEALRGVELLLDDDQAPELGPEEWWAHELEGCTVHGSGGELLGTVARLIELPSCEVLEVSPPDGGEPLLVPMVKDAIRTVSAERRRIEVDVEFLGLADAATPPGAGTTPDAGEQPGAGAEPAGREGA
jgi:16S rRNA processing protein RimM